MVELSISFEGASRLTWPQWKRLVPAIEGLGFTGHYISDHFNIFWEGYDQPSLEMVLALTYLADHSERVRFGPMVAPLSFREPVMLARQALALDDLGSGRMVLGVGTGWMEREHTMFGYDLGDIPTRFARLEEGLEVITRLLRSDEPVSFDGRFYRLRNAILPPPRRPGGPPVMVGGSGPKRTLPLVARFADVWNAQNVTPDELRERSFLLDTLIEQAGRRPEDVRRTLTIPVLCWRTPEEAESRLKWSRRFLGWQNLTTEQMIDEIRSWKGLVGTPEDIVSQIKAYEATGTSEIVMQWYDADDFEGLELLAEEVLPHVVAS